MNQTSVKRQQSRAGESGGARLKFLIVAVVIGVLAYAGYIFIPIQLAAYQFKDLMQHDVDVAVTQGYPDSWVTDQLKKGLVEYGVPENAVITPAHEENRIVVRVQFSKPIQFPGYTYNWEFDYTAKSTTFFTIK